MYEYKGKSVFGGIAIGRIKVYSKEQQQVKRMHIDDCESEKQRYINAVDKAVEQLGMLYDKALKEVGEANAAIFEMHQIMLEDDDYKESVLNIIDNQNVNAEYAVAQTSDNFSSMFAAMDDEYMRGRALDVRDISERLITILSGGKSSTIESDEPSIIIAEDLAPSETVQMDKEKILSFVSVKGSVNSHTAILARTMGIPALIGTKGVLDEDIDGLTGIVDGFNGVVYINPDSETLDRYKKEQAKYIEQKDVTLDGTKIKLYANIGNVKDIALVLANDAAGIGLFRSEFIYLERTDFPTEEEQFNIYKTVAENMAGKPAIIRTLDIGADKQCDYFNLDKEDNPAYGNIHIMYPMIANMWEIDRIKEIENEVKAELAAQEIKIGSPKTGIMIETPAAAMISDELAKKVDFFSIGTNDLTQYTLAVDRQNPKLDTFFDAHHPAVLKMIKMVVDNAHRAGIWAGICGELGADTSLTQKFLEMGVDELSVSPGRILPIRKIIRDTDVSEL